MSALSTWMRAACAVMLTLLLAARLLSPAGFMPDFDRGAVTIVVCPDATAAPMAVTHGGHSAKLHQPCPYAAGSSAGLVPAQPLLAIALLLVAAALVLGQASRPIRRSRLRDRPPLRGPPLLA